ncbi:hypothetical protein LPJ63_000471 [Coemansia sp. RSA 2711]|nr:hypothetical protein LPJ63_000471 [Coemansia sp. RSA 2711]KAJ2315798.1 hypothetical protein IWW54_000040 [Coemansia sp. RSA 2705]
MQHTSVTQRYHSAASLSPVPSLTNGTSRASSASSSVNTLSPGGPVSMPRDLLPHFEAAGHDAKLQSSKAPADGGRAAGEGPAGVDGHSQADTDTGSQTDTSVGSRGGAGADSPAGDARKRRRESASELTEAEPRRKRVARRARQPQTGSTDFVGKYGLTGLYNEFVRPYVGEPRRALPDVGTAYLRDVGGARAAGALDLVGLVLAPPKNDLERLDALPMAALRAAFRVSAGDAKRPRVSLKTSDRPDVHKRQKSGAKSDEYERQRAQALPRPQQPPHRTRQPSPSTAY